MDIAIFTEDLFEDVEFWYPFYRLKEAGHRPIVVGSGRKDKHSGKHGTLSQVDVSVMDADAASFGGVVVPGGYAPDKMRLLPEFADVVRDIHGRGDLVASLCHGPWILASAGILSGKRVTSWPSLRDDLVNAGANHVDQEVVIDRNIITSRGPDDLPAFMREVTRFLNGR